MPDTNTYLSLSSLTRICVYCTRLKVKRSLQPGLKNSLAQQVAVIRKQFFAIVSEAKREQWKRNRDRVWILSENRKRQPDIGFSGVTREG